MCTCTLHIIQTSLSDILFLLYCPLLGVPMYKTLHGLVTSVLYLALKIMAYLNNFLSFVHSIFVGCSFNIIYFVIDMIFLAVQYTVQHSPR
jgi:hypothetical protein